MFLKSLANYHNLSFSLHFEPTKRFIIFGELFEFQLKIDFTEEAEVDEHEDFTELLNRLGCSIESIEITEDSPRDSSSLMIKSGSSTSMTAPHGSHSFYIGKTMKSVESLPSMLKQTKLTSASTQLSSPTLSQSSNSLSSKVARKLNSFPCRNSNQNTRNVWNEADRSIYIPLEVFIDGESISLPRSIVKLRISLNELTPQPSRLNDDNLDSSIGKLLQLDDRNQNQNGDYYFNNLYDLNYNFEKITRISMIEGSIPVIRPLEVNLRTHRISNEEILLNLSLNYDLIRCKTKNIQSSNNNNNNTETIDDDADLDNYNFKIDEIDVLISDHFTSKKLLSSTRNNNNNNNNIRNNESFVIKSVVPEHEKNILLTGPKQEYSVIYRLNCLIPLTTTSTTNTNATANTSANLDSHIELGEDYRLKVDMKGVLIPSKVTDEEERTERIVSLSFECPIDIFSLFPSSQNCESDIKVLFKLISKNNIIKAFQPFSIEVTILNFSNNFKSFSLSYKGDLDEHKERENTQTPKFSHAIQEFYFENSHLLQCDPSILSYDFFDTKPVLIENIPSFGGSKQIRLRFIPMGIGCASLDGLVLTDLETNQSRQFDQILSLQIE